MKLFSVLFTGIITLTASTAQAQQRIPCPYDRRQVCVVQYVPAARLQMPIRRSTTVLIGSNYAAPSRLYADDERAQLNEVPVARKGRGKCPEGATHVPSVNKCVESITDPAEIARRVKNTRIESDPRCKEVGSGNTYQDWVNTPQGRALATYTCD